MPSKRRKSEGTVAKHDQIANGVAQPPVMVWPPQDTPEEADTAPIEEGATTVDESIQKPAKRTRKAGK